MDKRSSLLQTFQITALKSFLTCGPRSHVDRTKNAGTNLLSCCVSSLDLILNAVIKRPSLSIFIHKYLQDLYRTCLFPFPVRDSKIIFQPKSKNDFFLMKSK
jgi:hypothetical protein